MICTAYDNTEFNFVAGNSLTTLPSLIGSNSEDEGRSKGKRRESERRNEGIVGRVSQEGKWREGEDRHV